jgi:hypothetical protein
VTPLAKGEERVSLALEHVTNSELTSFKRFVSDMKDAIAYVGFRTARTPPGVAQTCQARGRRF